MALGSDDEGADDDDDLEGSFVPGEELFNRCINRTLEAQEVCLRREPAIEIPARDSKTRLAAVE